MYDQFSHFRAPPTPGGLTVSSVHPAKKHKRLYGAVLTIESPKTKQNLRLRFHELPRLPHLVLVCEDLDIDQHGLWVPTQADVAQGLDFARTHASKALLVHCERGVSRSTALTLAILADRLGPGHEALALQQLLELRPCACPNQLIVAHADALLHREGALVAAVSAWEQATPAAAETRRKREAYREANLGTFASALNPAYAAHATERFVF